MKLHSSNTTSVTRREFFRTAANTATAMTLPLILPSRLRETTAPSNHIHVGQIGCGRIARNHDLPKVL
ncbi:MAG TPA: gfo/Idh/MocA family oxidoreductase, partial [Opitutaceae bacterium]